MEEREEEREKGRVGGRERGERKRDRETERQGGKIIFSNCIGMKINILVFHITALF